MLMRRKILIGGVILSLALVVGWFVASPYWTLRQVAAAAKANDAELVSSYVDYPALREDVKTKLTARLIGATEKNDPTAALGRAMSMALMKPMVDAFVSPAGLKATFARMNPDEGAQAGPGGAKAPAKKPRVERLSLNSFRVGDPDQPGSGLVFKRRGLSWKLAGIDLPPEKVKR